MLNSMQMRSEKCWSAFGVYGKVEVQWLPQYPKKSTELTREDENKMALKCF